MANFKSLKVNHELSKEVSKRNLHNIEIKGCYNNVFYVVTEDMKSQREARIGNWNIAIGYFNDGTTLYYTRHAFIINNETQEVIDPTLPLQEDFDGRNLYYYPIVSLSLRDYLLTGQENGWSMDLKDALAEKEEQLREWLFSQGYRCLGLNPNEDYLELGIDESYFEY